MKKLKFKKDEGSEFYKELREKVDQHFSEKGIAKTGNGLFKFKMLMYFSFDILFYILMITSETSASFILFYLLMHRTNTNKFC